MKQETPMFWGCTLIHNYPFLIQSTKKVLGKLGIGIKEIKEFGCCPDPIYVKAYGEDAQLALSARNLALAREEDEKLLVVCNGCYNTLHGASNKLMDGKKRDEINQMLPGDMAYDGRLEIEHLLNTLHSQLPLLKTLVKKPLKGLRVAVHYGCHALYPVAVPSDNPKNPTAFDEIVTAAGAVSVDYESKLDCCGIPVIVFNKDEGDAMLQKKLEDLQDKVDCIVTSCPACFMRFDMPPREMKELKIPVLHVSELLCLAFGIPPEELFLEGHMIKLDPVLEKLGMKESMEKKMIEKYFNIDELKGHCEACREECTAAIYTRDTDKPFDPLDTVDKLLEGKYYEVIRGDEIWRCLQCGKCEERCPQNTGLKNLFTRLRELAIRDGQGPRVIDDKIKMLQETGYAMPRRVGVRKRMGIEPAPEIDSAEIKEILENLRKKRR